MVKLTIARYHQNPNHHLHFGGDFHSTLLLCSDRVQSGSKSLEQRSIVWFPAIFSFTPDPMYPSIVLLRHPIIRLLYNYKTRLAREKYKDFENTIIVGKIMSRRMKTNWFDWLKHIWTAEGRAYDLVCNVVIASSIMCTW